MAASEKPLHIDIPVKLSDVKAVLSARLDLSHATYQERHRELERDLRGRRRLPYKCGHVTLHDTAYKADRNIATGNPYKNLISDLIQKRGVKVELCGASWVGKTRTCCRTASCSPRSGGPRRTMAA
jgi:hypothetical protein